MTNVIKSVSQALSLGDFTQNLYEDLRLPYEKDSFVRGNMITVIVDSEYGDFKLNVAVQFDDTVNSVKQRFNVLLEEEYEYREGLDSFINDNYEHPSATQGFAFDSLTC